MKKRVAGFGLILLLLLVALVLFRLYWPAKEQEAQEYRFKVGESYDDDGVKVTVTKVELSPCAGEFLDQSKRMVDSFRRYNGEVWEEVPITWESEGVLSGDLRFLVLSLSVENQREERVDFTLSESFSSQTVPTLSNRFFYSDRASDYNGASYNGHVFPARDTTEVKVAYVVDKKDLTTPLIYRFHSFVGKKKEPEPKHLEFMIEAKDLTERPCP